MKPVEMYAATWCPYCQRARSLLEKKGVPYHWIDVDRVPDARREMMERGGGATIPQIFIDGVPVGGSDDLHALERAGRLDALFAPSAATGQYRQAQ